MNQFRKGERVVIRTSNKTNYYLAITNKDVWKSADGEMGNILCFDDRDTSIHVELGNAVEGSRFWWFHVSCVEPLIPFNFLTGDE